MSHSTSESKAGSLSGFPEEDLRQEGQNNPGYFPARLGQPLEDGRFCIVRKLGWGQYSSVWLAKDNREDRFVALKILTCESTKAIKASDPEKRSDEVKMLQKIASSKPTHRGFEHSLALFNFFEFHGPCGDHICLVTEVLACSVDDIRKQGDSGDRRLSMDLTKRITKQILHALDYLHNHCDIIHGDIKHDNILCRPVDLSAVVAQELVAWPSVTYDCGTEIVPSITPVMTQSLPITTEPPLRADQVKVVLADVGHSHWRQHHFQEIIQPGALRAPEVILGYPWDTSVDIWNLGCLITELLIGFWLFEYHANGDKWNADEDHLARMTEALGFDFDPAFISKCEHGNKFFKADGSFAHFTAHEEPTWPLEKLLKTFASVDTKEGDVEAAERFSRRCLQLVPEKRASAQELIEDPWLADV
ncbi:kinase-like protein [Dendrothele bispora CBS 962.96]|uniref:non-specific serine/threonine protein kinase n=1 Tax=Dendrothele bispora (strain CBS 962.96) TaxID=1314807 RepID=A0A4S8MSM8_DENBC|nr:kinase-like protein [Dendrothele bispora CBS 962.96]